MNRISRTVSAVVLSAALLVVVVTPAAQARSLDRHQNAKPAVSWFDMALTWLSNLVVGAPQAQGRGMETKTYTSTTTSGSGYAVPMTGSCIDPNGCTFSGGGF